MQLARADFGSRQEGAVVVAGVGIRDARSPAEGR
jgi:hypothetical protein